MAGIKIPLLPRRVRIANVLVVAATILYYSTISTLPVPAGESGGGAASGGRWSLTNHFFAYAILATSVAYALADHRDAESGRWRRVTSVLVATFSYGALLEIVQLRFEGRVFDPVDMVWNALGAMVVAILYLVEPYVEFVPVGWDPDSE